MIRLKDNSLIIPYSDHFGFVGDEAHKVFAQIKHLDFEGQRIAINELTAKGQKPNAKSQ